MVLQVLQDYASLFALQNYCAGYLGHPFRKIENEQISAQ
jgi:hypothetical protein